MKSILVYADRKYLHINIDKTKYLEFTNNPKLKPIRIDNHEIIEPVKPSDGYTWLGFCLSYHDNVPDIVSANLNKKMFNTVKFYNWLDVNESTPVTIKLRDL